MQATNIRSNLSVASQAVRHVTTFFFLGNLSNCCVLRCLTWKYLYLQLSIVFLLMRTPRVHQLTQESLYSSNIGSNSRAETISWMERRLYYLKEEMLMVEARLENMQHEYSSLKARLQRLERLRPKSWCVYADMNKGLPVKSPVSLVLI